MKGLYSLLFVGIAIAAATSASAETWPTRPIKLITPVSAGIATDTVARVVSDQVSRRLGEQVYVENVPGASGILGTAAAARAAPDGYTFLFASSGMLTANKFLFKSLPFDLDRDFAPVSVVCTSPPFAISVSPNLSATSLPQLIALAKARPGKLSYAIDISSPIARIMGELLKREGGIEMVQVPYRSTAQAVQDTMAGRVDALIGSALSVDGFVRAGKLRRIGITGDRPFPGMEDSPLIVETLPGFNLPEGWFAVVAPASTPEYALARLSSTIEAVLRDSEASERISSLGCIPNAGGTSQSAGAFLVAERERWRTIVEELRIKPQ